MSVAGAKSVLVYVLNKSISIVETLKKCTFEIHCIWAFRGYHYVLCIILIGFA